MTNVLPTPNELQEFITRKASKWAAIDLPCLPSGEGLKNLAQYMALLLKWNRALNLCGKHDVFSLLADLVQDSFFLAPFLESLNLRGDPIIWDAGAGAGLPGVPLRSIWTIGNYTWIESREKRAFFLETVQANLKLPSFHGYHGRFEDYLIQASKKPDLILSRAFLPWKGMLELCAPAFKANTILVVMANQAPATMLPGWKLVADKKYEVNNKSRWLWAIGKIPV